MHIQRSYLSALIWLFKFISNMIFRRPEAGPATENYSITSAVGYQILDKIAGFISSAFRTTMY
jgi:hypothetical protein